MLICCTSHFNYSKPYCRCFVESSSSVEVIKTIQEHYTNVRSQATLRKTQDLQRTAPFSQRRRIEMSSDSTCLSGGGCSSDTTKIAGILAGVAGAIFLAIGIFSFWRRWGRDPANVKKRVEDVELPAYTPVDPSLPSYPHSQSLALEPTPAEPAGAHLASEEGSSSYPVRNGTLPAYETHPR